MCGTCPGLAQLLQGPYTFTFPKSKIETVSYRSVPFMGGIHERQKEIRRRRHRRKKYPMIAKRAAKANASEKAVLAAKIRKMTTGAEVVIAAMGLEER